MRDGLNAKDTGVRCLYCKGVGKNAKGMKRENKVRLNETKKLGRFSKILPRGTAGLNIHKQTQC